jgi:hypothetical protein
MLGQYCIINPKELNPNQSEPMITFGIVIIESFHGVWLHNTQLFGVWQHNPNNILQYCIINPKGLNPNLFGPMVFLVIVIIESFHGDDSIMPNCLGFPNIITTCWGCNDSNMKIMGFEVRHLGQQECYMSPRRQGSEYTHDSKLVKCQRHSWRLGYRARGNSGDHKTRKKEN